VTHGERHHDLREAFEQRNGPRVDRSPTRHVALAPTPGGGLTVSIGLPAADRA